MAFKVNCKSCSRNKRYFLRKKKECICVKDCFVALTRLAVPVEQIISQSVQPSSFASIEISIGSPFPVANPSIPSPSFGFLSSPDRSDFANPRAGGSRSPKSPKHSRFSSPRYSPMSSPSNEPDRINRCVYEVCTPTFYKDNDFDDDEEYFDILNGASPISDYFTPISPITFLVSDTSFDQQISVNESDDEGEDVQLSQSPQPSHRSTTDSELEENRDILNGTSPMFDVDDHYPFFSPVPSLLSIGSPNQQFFEIDPDEERENDQLLPSPQLSPWNFTDRDYDYIAEYWNILAETMPLSDFFSPFSPAPSLSIDVSRDQQLSLIHI